MYKKQNKHLLFHDLGNIDYKKCWDFQANLFNETVALKKANRKVPEIQAIPTQNHLIFCNHPPVYTLGKSGSMDNVLLNEQELAAKKIQFYKINRGGDITYHGPGQIIGYPILDLDNFFTDLHRFMRLLEETVMLTLAEYGITGSRIKGSTGVWLDADNPAKARKICAYGVRCSRWVTMHGWAFNVNTDMHYFNYIVPCGITDKSVTSLHIELGVEQVDVAAVKTKLKHHFATLLEAKYIIQQS